MEQNLNKAKSEQRKLGTLEGTSDRSQSLGEIWSGAIDRVVESLSSQ